MNTSFIQFDKAASYIPGISTVVNLPEIIYKLFTMNELHNEGLPSDSIKGYLAEKSLLRCVVSLIPILGNLALVASDLAELARNGENEAFITNTPLPVTQDIYQLMEKREKVEAEFQAIVPLAKEILKNEATRLAPKLQESINVISNITNPVMEATDQCELVTKKIINFSGKDDDYLGTIIDTIALGAMVYVGSSFTLGGLFVSGIILKSWSYFRGGS